MLKPILYNWLTVVSQLSGANNCFVFLQAAHPGEPTAVSVIGKAAGARWKEMTPEQKLPYENMSTASKAEYARLKTLTPAERVMVAAAARMQQPDGTPMTTDPHALLAAQAQHGFAGQVMM